MNLNMHQASLYLHKLSEKVQTRRSVEVVLCPNTLTLQSLSVQVNQRQFKLGAQNAHWRDEGAFTGEVSAHMLRGIAKYLLVGHSERRHIFGETIKDTRSKMQAAVRNNIQPILCVGETAHERSEGETRETIHDQVNGGLANITSEEIESIVIAYEPVWAIGTGKNAKPNDVKEAVAIIRRNVASLYGKKASVAMRVLYGGSVNADNAKDYLAIDGVDGLLVGGASLQADTFAKITEAAYEQANDEKK